MGDRVLKVTLQFAYATHDKELLQFESSSAQPLCNLLNKSRTLAHLKEENINKGLNRFRQKRLFSIFFRFGFLTFLKADDGLTP